MVGPHSRPCGGWNPAPGTPCYNKRVQAAAEARKIVEAGLKGNVSAAAKAAVQTGKVLAEGAAMMVGLKSKTD